MPNLLSSLKAHQTSHLDVLDSLGLWHLMPEVLADNFEQADIEIEVVLNDADIMA